MVSRLTRFVVFLIERVKDDHRTQGFLFNAAIMLATAAFTVFFASIGYSMGKQTDWFVRVIFALIGGVIGFSLFVGGLRALIEIWDHSSSLRDNIQAAWQDASTKDKTE